MPLVWRGKIFSIISSYCCRVSEKRRRTDYKKVQVPQSNKAIHVLLALTIHFREHGSLKRALVYSARAN